MQWNLIKLRSERNETQEDVAELLGISVVTYRKKEHGKAQFKGDEMFILSEHFDEDIGKIFLPTKYTIRKQGQPA